MSLAASVAVCQTVPVRGDVAANVEEHLQLASDAADAGALLAVFPELSLTGYELDLADELAFGEEDARLDALCRLSVERGVVLVVGAPVRLSWTLHIGAFVIYPDGELDLVTKHHLGAFPAEVNPGGAVPPPELSVFRPGDLSPLVLFEGGVAAIGICADTGRPAHAVDAASRGAGVYLASMFVTPGEVEGDGERLAGYASENRMVVAMANYGGPTGGLPGGGRSSIWTPDGQQIVELPATGAGVAVGRALSA